MPGRPVSIVGAFPPPRIGFFGKLPSRGDFVRYNLSRALVDAWDAWLLASWSMSAPLGDPGQPAAQSHPWRFALAPFVCGPSTMTGVVMPSVDRIGRHFPFLLAVENGTADQSVLDAVEAIGQAAIDETHAPDHVASQIDVLVIRAGCPASGDRPSSLWWREGLNGAETLAGDEMPARLDFTIRNA